MTAWAKGQMRHPAFTSENQDALIVTRVLSGPSPFKAPASTSRYQEACRRKQIQTPFRRYM